MAPPRCSKSPCPYGCLVLIFFLCSCAPGVGHYVQINQYVMADDYDSALQLITQKEAAYANRNASLFNLEAGILAHYAGQYRQSNQYLTKAEEIMEALYTRSISAQAASFLLNDLTIPYRGEDFENVIVNLFMALNYAGLGLWEDALVEARKVDNKLNVINSRYDEGKQNVYREDAFVRFLMGILYEAEGEINDAFISYRKAEEIYRKDYEPNYKVPAPSFLVENLLSTAYTLEFEQEAAEIRRLYPEVSYQRSIRKEPMAEVLALHYNGPGPEKIEQNWHVPMLDGYIVKIAYPIFKQQTFQISHAEIFLTHLESGKTHHFVTRLMEDIGAIAKMNLDQRMQRIQVKAVARATSKYLLTKAVSRKARKEGGELAGLLVQLTGNLAGIATERADLRHWRLLPTEIRVGRILLQPGSYEGRIDFIAAGQGVVFTKRINRFNLREGDKKILMYRTLN